MRAFIPIAVVAFCSLCGCASAGSRAPRPANPAQIAALEASALRDSAKLEPRLGLLAAYRAQGRLRDALVVAEKALARWPNDPRVALLAGLTQEDLGEYRAARASYERALGTTRPSGLRSDLKQRLVLLQRRETQAYVKDALAREAELAHTPPRPHTLAVFPFAVPAPDSMLVPLGRALTAMLITDLARTDRLTVLDRTVVQMLADEIRLGQLGYVDEGTAARGGRLLGAERIVQGSLASAAEVLRLEAAVVSVAAANARVPAADGAAAPAGARKAAPAPKRRTPAPPTKKPPAAPPPAYQAPPPAAVPRIARVSESDRLEALFDMEKRLALRLYAAVGIELTPAERADVTARRTENLQAALAYGRGLLALDAGDLTAALRYFSEASRRDPAFTPARTEAVAVRALVAAGQVTTARLAAGAERAVALTQSAASVVVPWLTLQRDALAELWGNEGVTRTTVIELVIRRPGGGQ